MKCVLFSSKCTSILCPYPLGSIQRSPDNQAIAIHGNWGTAGKEIIKATRRVERKGNGPTFSLQPAYEIADKNLAVWLTEKVIEP